jgi:hypothetical protein
MQAGIPQRIYYLIVDGLENLLAQRRALGLQQLNEEETIKALPNQWKSGGDGIAALFLSET